MIIENALTNGFRDIRPHLEKSPYANIWVTKERMAEASALLELE